MSSAQQQSHQPSRKRSLESSSSSDTAVALVATSPAPTAKAPKLDIGAYLKENAYKGITPTFALFVAKERYRKSLVASNNGADYSNLPMHIILYILEFHELEIYEISDKTKHRFIGRHRNDHTRHMVLVFTNIVFIGMPPFIVNDMDDDDESDPLLTMSFSDPAFKNPWWLHFIFQNARHMKFENLYEFGQWQDYWTHFQYKFQQLRSLSLHCNVRASYPKVGPQNAAQILHNAYTTFGSKLRDVAIKTIGTVDQQVVQPFRSLHSCSESVYRRLTADCQKTVRHLVVQKNFDLPAPLDHITQLSIECASPSDNTSAENYAKVLQSMTGLKRLVADRFGNRIWVKSMLENVSSKIEHLDVFIRDYPHYEEYFDILRRFGSLRSITLRIYYNSYTSSIVKAVNAYVQWLIEHNVRVCFIAQDQSGRGYEDNLVKILRQLNDVGLLTEFRSCQYWSREMLEEAGFGLPTCNVVSASVLQKAKDWVIDDLIPLLKCPKIRDISIRAEVEMITYFMDMLWRTTLCSDFPHVNFSVTRHYVT